MDTKLNNELIRKADEALKNNEVKILKGETINESFNGQIAAFGVMVAMSGLRPALAVYQKKTEGCDRVQILNAIAVMIGENNEDNPGIAMSKKLFECSDDELNTHTHTIIQCSIALKHVIRTYKLS